MVVARRGLNADAPVVAAGVGTGMTHNAAGEAEEYERHDKHQRREVGTKHGLSFLRCVPSMLP